VAVHAGLFDLGRSMDEAAVRAAAAKAGVDLAELDSSMATRAREVESALGDNTVLARSLGFGGTPGLIVGRYKAAGALTLKQIESIIAQSVTPA